MAEQHQSQQEPSLAKQAAKAATAFAISGVLLVISGLTLTGTVILVTVGTPLLVIFSPVLVPAAITGFFLVAGFITSGGLGVAAASVMSWIYQYVTGKHPPGSEKLDHVQMALASKARDMKDRAEQYRQQQAHVRTEGCACFLSPSFPPPTPSISI